MYAIIVGHLDDLSHLRMGSESRAGFQLCAFDSEEEIQKLLKVTVGPENYSFLVWRDLGEEVVLEMQHLLLSCALPPISSQSRCVMLVLM